MLVHDRPGCHWNDGFRGWWAVICSVRQGFDTSTLMGEIMFQFPDIEQRRLCRLARPQAPWDALQNVCGTVGGDAAVVDVSTGRRLLTILQRAPGYKRLRHLFLSALLSG